MGGNLVRPLHIASAWRDIGPFEPVAIHGANTPDVPHMTGQPEGEVSGPGNDVGDRLAGFKFQRRDDLMGLLILIPCRVVQRGDVRLGVLVETVHLVHVAGLAVLGRGGGTQEAQTNQRW